MRMVAALLALAVLPMTVGAQTISQPVDIGISYGGTGAGQSFMATTTGFVVGIDVRNQFGGLVTVHLYNGANGSGIPNNVGVPAYTQSGITLTAVASPLFSHITLTTPFPVVAGNVYTFMLTGDRLAFNTANVYPGGTAVLDFATVQVPIDLAFQVYEVAAAATPARPASIPTLSEWTMLLLGLTLASVGAWRLSRSGRR